MNKYKIYLAGGNNVTIESDLDLESFCKRMLGLHVHICNVAIVTNQITMIEKL